MYRLILLCLCIRETLVYGAPVEKLPEQEIMYGKTATLHCRSNDEDYNFLLWELPNGDVIGPGKDYDPDKYEYEVLNGTLLVRAVSLDEEGVYTCLSSGTRMDKLKLRKIRMLVKKDWEDVWEHDESVNYYRIIIVIGCSFFILAAVFYVYKIIKDRHRLPRYLEASDEEDSVEEVFTAPGTTGGINENTNFFDKPSTSGYGNMQPFDSN